MEILGIGPMELILILIVALMVFGPDKLPQIGAKLGRGMREMRKATRAISDEINSTRAAVEGPAKELAEPFKDVADAAKAVGSVAAAAKNPGQALRDSVMRELNTPIKPEGGDEPAAAGEDENTIAPPQSSAQSADQSPEQGQERPLTDQFSSIAEPLPALTQPEAPVAALPASQEPAGQLPASAESSVLVSGADEPVSAPSTLDDAPAALPELQPTDVDEDDPRATDPLAPTPPQQ